ncbi:unnamed protein product [Rotaria magnacalcarata]|uniref:DDE-1 domain-containing protein n=1 Tax=Rotaria magnacalcarata TaxID=392030 RepID=A0A8S2R1U3_9BILA|nr:unnamed protein product [Rotaria magnacalcarata]CAF3912579.1 unnamed protein product [Rotaria magnacalcarata]CAF4144805.1 unnamed protein product [Rotaria magnacalcarata]
MKKSNYSKENLIKALEEYKNGATSSEVCLKYGVPASTVRNHNSNSQMTFGSGRPTVLKIDQEQKKIEASRRNGFTKDIRTGWFEKLELILRSNNLIARPHAIYNCDESGFSDETGSYEQSGGSGKNFTTSLICGNAAGEILPPFIVYSAKVSNPQWTFGGPSGSSFAVSDSEWITTSLFIEWFKSFIEHTKNVSKPLLLIMDNHSCHISIEVIELAQQNQIILLLLPPSCTHALQPLDTVTFSCAKQSWKRIVARYFLRTGRKTIRKIDLPVLFKELYSLALTPKQVVVGFSRAVSSSIARDSPVATSSFQSSSFISYDQNTSTTTLGFTNNNGNQSRYVLNELNSASTRATTGNNSSLTTNFNTFPSSDQTTTSNQLKTTNENSTRQSSFMNSYDLLQFLSFDPSTSFNSISFSNLDLQTDELNNISIPIDTNSSFMQITQSFDNCNTVSMNDVDSITEDDGQQILGFDPNTLSKTYRRDSIHFNGNRIQQTSIFDMDNDVDVSSFVAPIHSVQSTQMDANREIADPAKSIHLSPSTAVHTIVNDLLQNYVSPPTLSSKTYERTRNEGKYGEEITSSSRLKELKEKSSSASTKKQPSNSNKQETQIVKRKNEFISLSQATRALTNLQTSSTSNITID